MRGSWAERASGVALGQTLAVGWLWLACPVLAGCSDSQLTDDDAAVEGGPEQAKGPQDGGVPVDGSGPMDSSTGMQPDGEVPPEDAGAIPRVPWLSADIVSPPGDVTVYVGDEVDLVGRCENAEGRVKREAFEVPDGPVADVDGARGHVIFGSTGTFTFGFSCTDAAGSTARSERRVHVSTSARIALLNDTPGPDRGHVLLAEATAPDRYRRLSPEFPGEEPDTVKGQVAWIEYSPGTERIGMWDDPSRSVAQFYEIDLVTAGETEVAMPAMPTGAARGAENIEDFVRDLAEDREAKVYVEGWVPDEAPHQYGAIYRHVHGADATLLWSMTDGPGPELSFVQQPQASLEQRAVYFMAPMVRGRSLEHLFAVGFDGSIQRLSDPADGTVSRFWVDRDRVAYEQGSDEHYRLRVLQGDQPGPVLDVPLEAPAGVVDLAPGVPWLVLRSQGLLEVVDLRVSPPQRHVLGDFSQADVSDDGRWLVAAQPAEGRIVLFELASRTLVAEVPMPADAKPNWRPDPRFSPSHDAVLLLLDGDPDYWPRHLVRLDEPEAVIELARPTTAEITFDGSGRWLLALECPGTPGLSSGDCSASFAAVAAPNAWHTFTDPESGEPLILDRAVWVP